MLESIKILLLDMDGTLREPMTEGNFPKFAQDQKIIAGADKAIRNYANKQYICIGITNQGGVAAGYKSLDEAIAEQRYSLDLFPELKAIYLCPDFEGRQCVKIYRKGSYSYYAYTSEEISSWKQSIAAYPSSFLIGPVSESFSFRKPGCGMLQQAISEYSGLALPDFLERIANGSADACFVGDRPEDVQAAENVGIDFIDANLWRQDFVPSGCIPSIDF